MIGDQSRNDQVFKKTSEQVASEHDVFFVFGNLSFVVVFEYNQSVHSAVAVKVARQNGLDGGSVDGALDPRWFGLLGKVLSGGGKGVLFGQHHADLGPVRIQNEEVGDVVPVEVAKGHGKKVQIRAEYLVGDILHAHR